MSDEFQVKYDKASEAAYAAAVKVYEQRGEDNEDEEEATFRRTLIASQMVRRAKGPLDSECYDSILASALVSQLIGIELPPHSKVGCQLLGFARALAAMHAMTIAKEAIESGLWSSDSADDCLACLALADQQKRGDGHDKS